MLHPMSFAIGIMATLMFTLSEGPTHTDRRVR